MMCSKNHYKALLIDDLQLFVDYDKLNLKKIFNILKSIDYSKTKVIVVCNVIINKHIKLLDNISYTLTINYKYKLYESIFKQELNDGMNEYTLQNIIRESNYNINTTKINLSNICIHNNSKIDKKYDINEILTIIFNSHKSITDIFRLCSSDYNIISLNLLENAPFIVNKQYINTIYEIYQSICIGDYVECKYIDKCIDIDILLLFGCVVI